MLTTSDLQDAVATVKYKSNYSFHVVEPDDIQGPFLFVEIAGTVNGRNEVQIPPMLNYEAFFNWVLWGIKQMEIQECLESFTVDGKIYLDPHRTLY